MTDTQTTQAQPQTNTNFDLIELAKFNNFYPAPTVQQLRYFVWNSEKNGFNKVIRRIGTRIFIKMSEFEKWIEAQNPQM